MTDRKAKIGDRVRIKFGNPKRIGQLATVVSVTPIDRAMYGRGTQIQYQIQPVGEETILKVGAGHFDVVTIASQT